VWNYNGTIFTPNRHLLIWCAVDAMISNMTKFIGREQQLSDLILLQKKKSASLVVIKGRRRIGKSRLAEEYSHHFSQVYTFTGLPPDENITADMQRDEFIRQLREQRIPSSGKQDWGDLFFDLAQYSAKGQILIILDEITWMGSLDPTFLGKLKITWDTYFKKNSKLILIISGSNSSWIESNILSKTGFFGRVSYRLTLDELSLAHCAAFWGKLRKKISAYEILKVLSVTGGVPRYLEEIHPELSAEQNIYRLCYKQEGILFNEFDDIFADLFQKRGERYKSIIHTIVNGCKNIEEIARALGRDKGGDLSELLAELCHDGFISRDYSWHIKTGKVTKFSQYRVRDNYLRFYLKYILPHRHKIEANAMDSLPQGWEGIIGLQFENLVINHRKGLFKLLGIPFHEVIISNPYLQTSTARTAGCQIDFMIQTQFNSLYVCEIKFCKTEIGIEVIHEVSEKLDRLKIPKGYSIRPVLIHVNGVTSSLVEKNYFAHIIDFGEFLGGLSEY
jgi:uncharacterized protein